MRGVVAFLCLGLFLSGCSGEAADDPVAEGTGVVTDPTDYSYLLNDTGAHVHDYWGGKTELDVLDASRTSTWNNVNGEGTYWRRTFLPDAGNVVPQGTSSLRVTVDWSSDQTAPVTTSHGDVSLWVKPATTVTPRFVQVIESGDEVVVPVAVDESDLPHQVLSAWEFIVQYNGTSERPYNAFFGTTNLKATAVRGHELVPFPGHPDLWQGRDQLALVDTETEWSWISYTGTGSLPHRVRPLEGALVPLDAAFVSVDLTVDSAGPGGIQLLYHAANTREYTQLSNAVTAGSSAHFEIPVEAGMADGPYGNTTTWSFFIDTPSADSLEPQVFQGTYHLRVDVHRTL